MPKHGWYQDGVHTGKAFVNSIEQPYNGTQFQLGAANWAAFRKGKVLSAKVWNDMTPESFLLHLPIPDWTSYELKSMHTVRQVFRWEWTIK